MKIVHGGVLVALLTLAMLPAARAEVGGFTTYSELSDYYLQQRAWIAPIIPPLLSSSLDTLEAMIAKDDFSFQELDGWYFPWTDGPHVAGGDFAAYDQHMLVVYEDLSTASIKIGTGDGKLLASFKSEPFPNLNGLRGDAYEQALLAELNRRSIIIWVSFDNSPDSSASAFAASSSIFGGGIMMSMGGQYELEAVDFSLTNDGMAVTFAWPGDFTNRLDIYSYDGDAYNGLGSWKLADIGYSTAGTNQLRWVDTGQLGRGSPLEAGLRFYTAGKGGDVDSDNDGYADSYEHLVLNTDPNNGDTDGDGISDGPFDPDAGGPIVFGPDPFPLDPSNASDMDGDGIPDATDPDDDNDGLLDAQDPEPLIPGIIAPFKVVSVINTNPPGSDGGDEVFDVSSAGRMLSYAQGSDAFNGYGRIHGGIYINHDDSNLYIGVAGYSKQETYHGDDALLILLDTTTGGVSSLSAISSGPRGLSRADNLNFQVGVFEPDVGILVGNRNEDGRNNSTAQLGGKEYGQGVYWLSGSSATDLSPAFTSTGSSPISQWGDTPYSTNLANAGIEIAIPLSNILQNAWSPASTTFVQVAAIVIGGDDGTYQHLSTEAYGTSVSGSLGYGNTTLLGEKVYLSPNSAPTPESAPLFADGEVMLQGFGWNVPRPLRTYYTTMTLAGSFTAWNPALNNMTSVGDDTWEYIHNFSTPANGVAFKFAANGTWSTQWGETNQTDFLLPITNEYSEWGGPPAYAAHDIVISNTLNGLVRFRFNNASQIYSVEAVSNGTVTTLLPGFATNYWYERLKQEVESNQYARFKRVWMNPPQKGKSGAYSSGYDVFDLSDLGTYNQKDTVATRYGTETQLKACVQAFSAKGIDCIADMVLNHMNNSDATYRYDYQYSSHNTFEKRTSGPTDTNGYFNVNYTNYPFQYDHGFGLPSGVKAWSNYPTAHSADVNERNPYMRNGMKNNGSWLQGKVAYRGCRFDYSEGMAPWFFAEYMDYGLMKGRFAVAEYWAVSKDASAREHQTWISLMEDRVCSFDFPLHEKLAKMCNRDGTFDMEELSYGALIQVNPSRAVTFVESHDEIRPFGADGKEGMKKDKELAYAFILMSEGHPCVFRQDYSDAPYVDADENSTGWQGSPLKPFIDLLIDVRTNYVGGTTTYISTANKADLFIAKRNGTATKDGCIFVINDDMTQTLTNTVNTGWADGTVLVDALQTNHIVTVQGGGMAPLSASNRFYRVYVRQQALLP